MSKSHIDNCHKKYQQLVSNRKMLRKTVQLKPEYKFKPQLCKKSLRIINEAQYNSGDEEPHFDRLIGVGKKMKQKRYKLIKENQDEELKGCTFIPMTNYKRAKENGLDLQRILEKSGKENYTEQVSQLND